MNNNISAFLKGFLYGMIAPAIVWIIFNSWHKDWVLPDKPLVPYLIAIAINLVILRYHVRKGNEKMGYSIILITFVFAVLIFILKLKH